VLGKDSAVMMKTFCNILTTFRKELLKQTTIMFSQSKIAVLFLTVVAVTVVEGFAPIAQPRLATSTELGAFFQKSADKSPTVSSEAAPKKSSPFSKFAGKKESTAVKEDAPPAKKGFSFGKKDAKKAPIKKVVAKKNGAKKVTEEAPAAKKKFSFGNKKDATEKTVAKKAPVKKVVVKKAVAKKAPVKKVVAKKVVAKKVVAKKVVAKKVVAKKPVQKKVVAKKAPVVKKKLVSKTSGAKKSFAKNSFSGKKPQSKDNLVIYERQCHIN